MIGYATIGVSDMERAKKLYPMGWPPPGGIEMCQCGGC